MSKMSQSADEYADDMTSEDARAILPSHYSDRARLRIRERILTDFEGSGVKLPTYAKLLARYIAPLGVSEAWLAKLSHQTLAKTLAGSSNPRYPVWACLHLYLWRKDGRFMPEPHISDAEELGLALSSFGQIAAPEQTGKFAIHDATISIEPAKAERPFARAQLAEPMGPSPQSESNAFGVAVQSRAEGLAFSESNDSSNTLNLILRDVMTRRVTVRRVESSQLLSAERRK